MAGLAITTGRDDELVPVLPVIRAHLASVKLVADGRSPGVTSGVIQADDSKIGPTMPVLTALLSDAQLKLLDIMSEPYMDSGEWPVWHYVEAVMYDRGHDARAVLKSLPVAGSTNIGSRSYGLAWYDHNQLADDSRPALTAAAGLHVPRLEPLFEDKFISVLKYLISCQQKVKPSPDRVERAFVTPDDFKRNFPTTTSEFRAALPDILQHEPLLWRGINPSGSHQDGWRFELGQELMKLKDVDNLAAYVSRVVEIVEEERSATFQEYGRLRRDLLPPRDDEQPTITPTVTPVITTPLYVNQGLITELDQKQGQTKWSLDKLLQLLRELNDCYAEDRPFACHALVRAIIDHVPPILGCTSFEAAVSSYKWTRTDKKYMTRLLDFKTQADDVLHRHIRTSKDPISMHDLVPLGSHMNALLRECVDKL
ncbi:hypothetical protein ACFYWY_11130 [Streptomyces sp. NPDC002870]|uniref:hypothetical protein n=1 Tax=Streptomyces sp. NPDC002870 TaxID=3364666 RepID=UPI00367788EE